MPTQEEAFQAYREALQAGKSNALDTFRAAWKQGQNNGSFMTIARGIVYEYAKDHMDKSDPEVPFMFEDVYVVWFSKTLQNWKALVSTNLPDGMYYEVTYNGDRAHAYLDAYKKVQNVVIPLGEDQLF